MSATTDECALVDGTGQFLVIFVSPPPNTISGPKRLLHKYLVTDQHGDLVMFFRLHRLLGNIPQFSNVKVKVMVKIILPLEQDMG